LLQKLMPQVFAMDGNGRRKRAGLASEQVAGKLTQ
jgi:hypothetical protein